MAPRGRGQSGRRSAEHCSASQAGVFQSKAGAANCDGVGVGSQEWAAKERESRRDGEQGLSDRVGARGERSTTKGKNFQQDEERQLTRSVLAISQDPVTGNQQRVGAFWQRIFDHYNERHPEPWRPARSLETKWGFVKHDVTRFCAVYQQVLSLNKSGTSPTDLLRMAKELYRTKTAKNAEFTYEHCWLLVKDFPRWAAGWSTMKSPTSSTRKSQYSDQESQACTSETFLGLEQNVEGASNQVLRERPSGTKAAKEVLRESKVKEGLGYAQVKATADLTAATMRKNKILEEQNMLLLMTTPSTQIVAPAAQEYLRLRQEEELMKLHLRLEADRLAAAKLRADLATVERAALDAEGVRAAEENREREETLRQLHEQQLRSPDSNKSGGHHSDSGEFECGSRDPNDLSQTAGDYGGVGVEAPLGFRFEATESGLHFPNSRQVPPPTQLGVGGFGATPNEQSPRFRPHQPIHRQNKVSRRAGIDSPGAAVNYCAREGFGLNAGGGQYFNCGRDASHELSPGSLELSPRHGSQDCSEGGEGLRAFNFALDGGGGWNLNSGMGFNSLGTREGHWRADHNRPAHRQGSNPNFSRTSLNESWTEENTQARAEFHAGFEVRHGDTNSQWDNIEQEGGSDNVQANSAVDIDLSLNGPRYYR